MPQYNEGFTSKFILEGCQVPPPRCKRMELCVEEIREACDRDPLSCPIFIQRATTMVLEDIGMTPLKEASVEFCHPRDPSKNGSSAVTIIAESHGGGHSWGEAQAFRFVVDSCKPYDITKVADLLCFLFTPKRCLVWVEEQELHRLRDLKTICKIHGRTEYQVGVISKIVTFLKGEGRDRRGGL